MEKKTHFNPLFIIFMANFPFKMRWRRSEKKYLLYTHLNVDHYGRSLRYLVVILVVILVIWHVACETNTLYFLSHHSKTGCLINMCDI